VFNDVFFYLSHRIVHHKSIYGYVHKQHHTYTGTIGVAAEYASPIEQILSNQAPPPPSHASVRIFCMHAIACIGRIGTRTGLAPHSHCGIAATVGPCHICIGAEPSVESAPVNTSGVPCTDADHRWLPLLRLPRLGAPVLRVADVPAEADVRGAQRLLLPRQSSLEARALQRGRRGVP
jgi:hypothetical protein